MDIQLNKIDSNTLNIQYIEDLFYNHCMYEKTYENSLFKKILSACITSQSLSPLDNHTLYLLQNDTDILGLSMVKSFEKEIIPLFKLKDSFRSNSKIGAIYDKEFILQDWFQIYIKPEYRNKGFAVSLLHFVEDDLIKQYQLNSQQLPLMIGKGLAYDLINKKGKYFSALAHDKIYTNKVSDLSHLTRDILDYIFEPENRHHKSFLSTFNQQFSIISNEDKNNQLKNKILGIKKF